MHVILLLAAVLFTPAEQSRLDSLIARVNLRTKAQLAVVTVPNTNGLGTREYTTREFNARKLGSAERNDGILIALFPQQRATEIVIGSGLRKALPQYVLDEAAHQPPTAEGQAEAIKILGARLAGFPRHQSLPVLPFATAALIAAAITALCLHQIHAFKARPQALPVNALTPARSDFRDDKPHKFFVHQSQRPPGGFEPVPPQWIWGAWLALCTTGATLAAAAAALTNPNLEPNLWLLIPILGLPCTLTFSVLGSSNLDELDLIPTLTITAIGATIIGGILAYAATKMFLSDTTLITVAIPATVFGINAAIGYQIASNFESHVPKKFICELCASTIRELTAEEIRALRPKWHKENTPVRYRGWRCQGACKTSYLAFHVTEKGAACPNCKTPTLKATVANGKRTKECTECNYKDTETLPNQNIFYPSETPTTSTHYDPTPQSSTTEDYWQRNQQWDTPSNDSPSTGGTTDGDGASSTW